MSEENNLKDYLGVGSPFWLTLLPPALFLLIGGVVYAINHEIIVVIVCIIVAVLIFVSVVNQRSISMKHWEALKQRNSFDDVISDFSSATPYIDDKLRAGKCFLFVNGTYGRVFSYKEINEIYVNRIGTRAHSYILTAKLKDGDSVRLCDITGMKVIDIDYKEKISTMIKAILDKNGSITISCKWPEYRWIEQVNPTQRRRK